MLFDKNVIKDSYDMTLEIKDKDVGVDAHILGDGYLIAKIKNRDALFTCKSFDQLNINDIYNIYRSHGDDYWKDSKIITPYELCINQKLEFKMWLN